MDERQEQADRHWAIMSFATQLAAAQRPARRREAIRVRIGLMLVRVGLAIAPLKAEDLVLR